LPHDLAVFARLAAAPAADIVLTMPRHPRLSDSSRSTSAAQPIRVVLAEAHAAMRRSLRRLLDADEAVTVLAETSDLEHTRDQVRRLAPDVLVLDLRMGRDLDMDEIGELRRGVDGMEVVVLTMHESPLVASRALAAGATGFVLKDTADAELLDAIHSAARHERYASPRISSGLTLLARSRLDSTGTA
jgi:two-component system response regulator NreC